MVEVEEAPPRPLQVFLSYSHDDFGAMKRLQKYLGVLDRRGFIDLYVDEKTRPGDDWDGDIEEALERADVVIFMITESLLDSTYCMGKEFVHAYYRKEAGTIEIVPFVVKTCRHRFSEFSGMEKMVKVDGRPVPATQLGDDAYDQVADWVGELAQERGIQPLPIGNAKPKQRSSPRRTVWHGMSREAAGWYGRQDLVAELGRLLRQEPHLPALLTGPGGVGKTWVAAQYAQANAARYDVVAKIPAEVASTMRVEWTELANRLTLGASDQETARVSMLGWLVKERRCLIVFDNATPDTADKVFDLLPEDCAADVIITARTEVTASPKVRHLTVGPLAAADALEMLVDAAGPSADLATLRAISQHQDYHPFSLAQAAAKLREGKNPERYLQQLRAKAGKP